MWGCTARIEMALHLGSVSLLGSLSYWNSDNWPAGPWKEFTFIYNIKKGDVKVLISSPRPLARLLIWLTFLFG
jgi:hypothetical protein